MRKGWSMSLQLGLNSGNKGFKGQGVETEEIVRRKRDGRGKQQENELAAWPGQRGEGNNGTRLRRATAEPVFSDAWAVATRVLMTGGGE